MNLEQMQALPHKWWKKSVRYTRCHENILIDLPVKEIFIDVTFPSRSRRINDLIALEALKLEAKVTPSRFDWFYAINTELLEWQDATSIEDIEQEMADVAIFCALCLKYYFNVRVTDLMHQRKKTKKVFVGPVYSWDVNVRLHITNLLLWALNSPVIEKKIRFNQRRIDHGNFRH